MEEVFTVYFSPKWVDALSGESGGDARLGSPNTAVSRAEISLNRFEWYCALDEIMFYFIIRLI